MQRSSLQWGKKSQKFDYLFPYADSYLWNIRLSALEELLAPWETDAFFSCFDADVDVPVDEIEAVSSCWSSAVIVSVTLLSSAILQPGRWWWKVMNAFENQNENENKRDVRRGTVQRSGRRDYDGTERHGTAQLFNMMRFIHSSFHSTDA